MDRLKEEILELLDKDKEFRYAVAGYLGLSEILKRLDKLEKNQNKIWKEIKALREGQNKLWENQNKLWEEVKSLREGQDKLWENQNKLWENQQKLWEEVKSLREGQNKLWENQNKLWEEIKDLRAVQNRMAMTLEQMAVTLERLIISIEEEGRDVVRSRLKSELGLDVELDRLFIDEKEINIYGVADEICVIGEVAVRLGVGLVEELEKKVKLLKSVRPELIKPKMIKVIYTDYAVPNALELAIKYNTWVLNWKKDLTPRRIIQNNQSF